MCYRIFFSFIAVVNGEQLCEGGRGEECLSLSAVLFHLYLCVLGSKHKTIQLLPVLSMTRITQPGNHLWPFWGLPLCLLVYYWGTLRSTSNEPKTESLFQDLAESLCHPTAVTVTRTAPSETAGGISPTGQGSSHYGITLPDSHHFVTGFQRWLQQECFKAENEGLAAFLQSLWGL